MRAERDRRASILTAEGSKQSQILNAEGAKQAAVLTAEGQKTAAILRAEGEAKAIDTVFQAIHAGDPDQGLLSYQYLQMLPKLAQGDANKISSSRRSSARRSATSAARSPAPSRAVPARPAAGAAGTVSAYIVDDAVEGYAAAHTTPPPAHLRALAAETRETLQSPQMLTGDIEGRFLEFPRVPRAAAARARDRDVLGLQRAVDGGRVGRRRADRDVRAARRARRRRRAPHLGRRPRQSRSRCGAAPALETIATLDGAVRPRLRRCRQAPGTWPTTRRCCRSSPRAG